MTTEKSRTGQEPETVTTNPPFWGLWIFLMVIITFSQSLMCISKLLIPPTLTIFSIERVDSYPLPTITLCGFPFYNTTVNSYQELISQEDNSFPLLNLRHLQDFGRRTGKSDASIYEELTSVPEMSFDYETSSPSLKKDLASDFNVSKHYLFYLGYFCGALGTQALPCPCFSYNTHLTLAPRQEISIQFKSNLSQPLYWKVLLTSKHDVVTDEFGTETVKEIKPYFVTRFELEASKYEFLNTLTRPCEDRQDYYYPQCVEACFMEKAKRLNLCDIAPFHHHPRNCQSEEDRQNAYRTFSNILEHPDTDGDCLCRLPCKRIHYKATVPRLPIDRSKSRTSGLKIIFTRPTQEIYQENLNYNFSQMLGELGGIVGMFLGMSVVSLYPPIYQFIQGKLQQRRDRLPSGESGRDPQK